MDTRPKINAMYNRAAGKGYEAEAFYANTKFVFKVSSQDILSMDLKG